MKSAFKAIALLSCCFLQSFSALATSEDDHESGFEPVLCFYETDSYIARLACWNGNFEYIDNLAFIIGISLKDGILQSKEINLPDNIVYEGVNYTITEIMRWGEWLKEPERTNTSENLELAVERIILPNTIEKIEFHDFNRFRNLRMVNTPASLKIKSISVKKGDFNEGCSSAYKDNIVKQWKSRENGFPLSRFDNYSYNNYKWSLTECTGAGVVIPKYEWYETDSYIAYVACYEGKKTAAICGISLKERILQSKEINLPANIVCEGINCTITDMLHWGEALKEPKRSTTSENLELAVEKIILPNTIEKIDFYDFNRFKNLKMINTPTSLDTKSISETNGGLFNFNEECSSAYKDNIVKQWASRENGASLSTFDNHSYNDYKWSLKECTGAGVAALSNTNDDDSHDDNPGNDIDLNNNVEATQSFYSDVNTNIPTVSHTNENIFAVIVSNENYRRESKVEYALSDGEIFKEYCHKTLGIPQSNIHHVNDATLNDIRVEIQWIQKVAAAYNGEAKFIFYYAGHGVPDEGTSSAYLLPSDGFGGDVTTSYKISDLYATLSACPSQYTLVLLDACFSGAQRSGKMLASSRGVALKAKTDVPTGNMIVFSAATGDETAFPYKEQQHGMFTYFLLKKLQESNGSVTFGELGDYIIKNVSRRSIVENSKSQTPTIIPAPDLTVKWREMHF